MSSHREARPGGMRWLVPACAWAAAGCLAAGCTAQSAGCTAPSAGNSRAPSDIEGRAASLTASSDRERTRALPLVLRRALPLELEGDVEREFQPSGLLWWQGQLLTVSDKHDRAIFVIDLGSRSTNVRPFVRFEPPPDEPPPLDYEGLSVAPSGGWLLSSEARHRLLHVELERDAGSSDVSTGRARWLTPSLRAAAAPCLQRVNAGLEGVTTGAGGDLLLAAEREPRCLIELAASGDPASIRVSMPEPSYPVAPPRNADYADLTRFGQRSLALFRAAHRVVELERTPQGYREGLAFSYREAEEDPRYRYEDRTYGLAEGLAIAEHELFIVVDNNGKVREADGADRRPLLFVFERPPEL